MAKQSGAGWDAGVDNSGRTIKLKDKISVDLLCVGVTEGKGKFAGMVGSLTVLWGGKREEVNGGKLTTKERQEYFSPEGSAAIVGKIVEVHALGITPDGKLREPVFQHVRHDKTEPSE